MELDIHPRCTTRRLENLALFGGSFVLNEVTLYAADKLADPQVMDVPMGGALAAGLAVSSVVTFVFDRAVHR